MKSDLGYDRGYSIALLCLGLFLLLGVVQFRFIDTAKDPFFAFVSNILSLVGVSCVVVALLRWMRVPAALPATEALSWFLLIGFPFGTFVAFYWLTKVRRKELPPKDHPRRAGFYSTVALFLTGLLLLDMALVFRFVQGLPGEVDPLLRAFEWGGWISALGAIAMGARRSVRLPPERSHS